MNLKPLFILLSPLFAAAQSSDSLSYYLVYLGNTKTSTYQVDRPGEFLSPAAIERRKKRGIPVTEKDLPPDRRLIGQLGHVQGIRVINISRWFNAAEISCPKGTDVQTALSAFPFVSRIEYLGTLRNRNSPVPEQPDSIYFRRSEALKSLKRDSALPVFVAKDYNRSWQQISMTGTDQLQKTAGRNPGIHIAVFDAGFYKAYRIPGMEDLLDSTTVIRDFSAYDNSVWEDDQHGTSVLGFMKTYRPGHYIGSAPFARYSLIRTENAHTESLSEEVNWLMAAEFADSLGVDMIASSVGYHTFDETVNSHTYADLDGRSSIIARAANEARARGIMVICSAGNEGNSKWRRIGTPADAPGAIAVGACDEQGYHAGFSSYGPSADGRIKPDFIVPGYKVTVASAHGYYSGNGTSYATPLFAGAVAGLMGLFPDRSHEEILDALSRSATHSHFPDSAYGRGIPDFGLAMCMLGKCPDGEGDIFWTRENAVLFQDLVIHFRSAEAQSGSIRIKTSYRNREITLYRSDFRLKAGEWYRNDHAMAILRGEGKRKRKRIPLKKMTIIFETRRSSFQRIFVLP